MFKRIILIFIAAAIIAIPLLSSAQFRDNDNPGADQPDDSALLGDDLYPTDLEKISLKISRDSAVAILDNGYSRHSAMLFGLFLPVRMISEDDLRQRTSFIRMLIIPSGGLTSVPDRDKLGAALKEFTGEGGTLFVFSQRTGNDYSILPVPDGKPLTVYGWSEEQSRLASSSFLSMSHPIVSGLTASLLNLNIDGTLESFPENSKPLLRNRISGQPVMIVYKYGKGTVVATTLFTDWAYLHQQATRDEINLFAGLINWSGLTIGEMPDNRNRRTGLRAARPVPLPPLGFSVQSDDEIYMAGDKAAFTIRLWNFENRARRIKIYYDGKGEDRELLPKGSTKLSYSLPVYSARRLWVYFYDENEIFLQTVQRGYSVVYP